MSRLVPAPDALVGKRFDVAVAKMLGISRAKAADLIESGQARVLGRDISKSSTLQAGETVEFDIVEERSEPEPIAHDMAVVYEDDDVVVVDKPVGVAAHASVGWTGPTVLGSLIDRGVHITSYGAAGRQGIVSRLDVGTSGLMLVCKSDLAYVEMRRQFAEHEVVKTYHALVQRRQSHHRSADRTRQSLRLPLLRDTGRQRGHHALGRDGTFRRSHARIREPGNRPHPSDPRAFLIHRASVGGGRHVRRESAAERGAWP